MTDRTETIELIYGDLAAECGVLERPSDFSSDAVKAAGERIIKRMKLFESIVWENEMLTAASRPDTQPPQSHSGGLELTEWERSRLAQHVAGNALTYMGHHARGGLKPDEVAEMERWKALSDKLKTPARQPNLEVFTLTDDMVKAAILAEQSGSFYSDFARMRAALMAALSAPSPQTRADGEGTPDAP